MADPGEIRLLALEQTGDGIHQHCICRPCLKTTRFSEGQDPLHPVIALGAGCPLGAFAPEDAKASGPFSPVVGWRNTMLGEKDPQGVHLPSEAAGEPPRVIRMVMIRVDQRAEPGIPRPPFPARGWGRGPRTETWQLGERPCATGRHIGIVPSCQAPGRPDEMGQAGLPRLHPMAIHAVTVTDEEACPGVDEGGTGFVGPMGMQHGQRRGVTDHHPQPLERVREKPGRFIDRVDHCVTHLRGNRRVVWLNGLGQRDQGLFG